MWWTAVFLPVWTVSILPNNATPFEKVLDGIDGDIVARDPLSLIGASRSDATSPLEWLPYLADERSVDEYSSAWPEAQRREVVRGSFPFHRVKGTRNALQKALTPLGYSVTVVEWFEHEQRPAYTFRLSVSLGQDDAWTSSNRGELVRVANGSKNAHTKLERIEYLRRMATAMVYVGGVSRRRRTLRVGEIPAVSELRSSGFVYVAAILKGKRTLRIGPRPS